MFTADPIKTASICVAGILAWDIPAPGPDVSLKDSLVFVLNEVRGKLNVDPNEQYITVIGEIDAALAAMDDNAFVMLFELFFTILINRTFGLIEQQMVDMKFEEIIKGF